MNPLSAWTYYRRHKQQAVLLASFIGLTTLGLYLMGALSWALFVEPARANRMFLSKFSIVMPTGEQDTASVAAQLRAHPEVAQVIPVVLGQGISLPQLIGSDTDWLNLLGLAQDDVATVLDRSSATIMEGQLLQPRTNGIMLSEQVAANLGLQVGDLISAEVDPHRYSNIADPLRVVATLQSDVRLGIMSAEYLQSHEIYHVMPVRFLVLPRKEGEDALDEWLRDEVEAPRTGVLTLRKLQQEVAREYAQSLIVLAPIVVVAALGSTFVVGAANRIAFSRRLTELGILNATGHSRPWLTRRLTAETAVLSAVAWAAGIGTSWLVLLVLELAILSPRGHDLDVITWAPVALVLPLPAVMIGFTRLSVRRVLARLDPIAVIERGELSQERLRRRPAVGTSSPTPLAAWTYCGRHTRRGVSATAAMALMILGVAIAAFLFSVTHDAQRTRLGDLKHMSTVGARLGSIVDPALIAQIRAHPTVDRVIPCRSITLLDMSIPPLGRVNVHPYAVYAQDLAYLVQLYGLGLKEGHLPRPHSSELVLPERIALNRGLEVGDVIGDPEHPAYPGAPVLPTPFTVSGILTEPPMRAAQNWLSFISLEFLESHEAFRLSRGTVTQVLVAPKPGQKARMDAWLETELASHSVSVYTHQKAVAGFRRATRDTPLIIALIEGVLAVVAAGALAVLNHILVSQRQPEFGLLHALGHQRAGLIWRTVRETAFTTGTAWGISGIACLFGLLYLQFVVFAPQGLRLDMLNPMPWLFTLPIPAAVLLASGGTVARMLAKLDAVSILERRT
jgi:ABC-type lipoprotein release transport system permease subunit